MLRTSSLLLSKTLSCPPIFISPKNFHAVSVCSTAHKRFIPCQIRKVMTPTISGWASFLLHKIDMKLKISALNSSQFRNCVHWMLYKFYCKMQCPLVSSWCTCSCKWLALVKYSLLARIEDNEIFSVSLRCDSNNDLLEMQLRANSKRVWECHTSLENSFFQKIVPFVDKS